MSTLVLIVIFGIGYLVGTKQEGKKLEKHFYNAKGKEIADEVDNMVVAEMVRLAKEVPAEWLANGDKERTLHIAGIKEATPAKITKWENERRAKVETKTELSMDSLLSKLNKTDLQIKAGIIENTDKTGVDIKIEVKEIDPITDNKKIMEAARKESDRETEQRIKIDFDALNFSRISNEARKQITEIVKQDLENKIRDIEKNTPEINEDTESK